MKAARPSKAAKGRSVAEPDIVNLLQHLDQGKTAQRFQRDEIVFSQGDMAETIYFIQTGKVRVTVVSPVGREAVLATLGPRGFLGEGSLAGQTHRVSTATTIAASTLLRIENRAMLRALHAQPRLSEKFTASLLLRNLNMEMALCDQLSNHSEKRLACILLKLARFGPEASMPAMKMPRISHDTLAEMTGTTRARITHLMMRFRKLGLIEYNGGITVRAELLTDIVLCD